MIGIKKRKQLTENEKNIIKQLALFYESNNDILSDFSNIKEKKEIIKKIYKKLNYDNPPQLVSNINQNKNKGLPIYRGISAESVEKLKEYIDEFINGEVFLGGRASIYGTGIYTICDEDSKVASKYASDGDINNIGVVIESKMDTTSKVIEYNMLEDIKKFSIENLSKMYNKKIDNYLSLLEDSGLLASLLGYDAILVKEKNYVIILNRNKMIVDDITLYNNIDLISNKQL